MLYNRINTEGYKDSQGDIQAVSGMVQNIRGAVLDYQACSNDTCATGVQLKSGCRQHTGDKRAELQAECESHVQSMRQERI